jgi:hypothetical protein
VRNRKYWGWGQASTRARISSLLIMSLLGLAIYLGIRLTVGGSAPQVSIAAAAFVLGSYAIVVAVVHLAIVYWALNGSLLGRMLATGLGVLSVLFWISQPDSLSVAGVGIGSALAAFSWLPDGPKPQELT